MARKAKGSKTARQDAVVFEVEAAGGVVVRKKASGIRVLLVHRDRYDDWTFPKGKLDPGETARQAAKREVLEETGFRCRLKEPLPEVQYIDQRGRRKRVRYWLMKPKDGEFVPNDEVDRIKWVTPAKARRLLTYRRDHAVLKNAMRIIEFRQ